jgi:hypothetical protein
VLRMHFKPLFLAAFAVISTHQSALDPRGGLYGPFSLYVMYKEGLCPSSGGMNRLIMMIEHNIGKYIGQLTATRTS